MPYLLDADVLIRAKREHYRFTVFPCFWDWILAQAAAGMVMSVAAIKRELNQQNDDLSAWVAANAGAFLDPDDAVIAAAQRVSAWVQDAARPYLPAAKAEFFAAGDYWLISHALAHNFTVVTHEVSAPQSKGRVKIPDVCNAVGVPHVTPFDMLQSEGARFG